MSKIGARFKYLEQPIFCLCTLYDYVLVASGGGGKKFGVRNKIISYKILNNSMFSEDICHSVEFEKEIPVFISSYEPMSIFCTCIDNLTVFFSLNANDGTFEEIIRVKISDFFDADIYQSVCRLDNKGKYLATGFTDGVLKVWNLNISNADSGVLSSSNKIMLNPTISKETQAHAKSINDIVFLDDKNMVVTAGADGLCKIYEATTLKLLKKISFRVSLTEKSNYSFRGLKYDEYSNTLFTIQAPMRGTTYLTKWSVKNNFEPINSLEVSDTICTSIDYSPSYALIGLADCKGSVIFVDASGQMSKIKELSACEFTVKSVAFKNGNLVSGSADNALQLHCIYRKNLISFSFIIKLLVLCLVAYYVFVKIKTSKENVV